MICQRCGIREDSIILGTHGEATPQHLCDQCAKELSPEYAEFARKLELSAVGKLVCEICGQRPAPHLSVLGTDMGFWCAECRRARPLSEELRGALGSEAAKVGLSETQLRQSLEEISQRFLKGDFEPPGTHR
jgi:hypothetical protein